MRSHSQAFLNFAVQATDKKGKPRYNTFKKWFNYDEALKKAKGQSSPETDRFYRLKEHLRRQK